MEIIDALVGNGMSSSRVALLAVSGCLTLSIVTAYLRAYFRLRHIPGPWIASVSPFWLFYQTCRGQKPRTMEQLFARYGPLARVNIDQLITDDPDLYRIMNSATTSFSRGRWYDGVKLEPDKDHVFSARNKSVHAALKSKLSPGYLGKDGMEFEKAVDPVVEDMLKLIKDRYCDTELAFDFSPLAGYFAMDSIAKLAYGQDIGYLKKNEDVFQYFEETKPFSVIFELVTDHPWILGIVNILKRFVRPQPGDKTGMGAVMGVAYKVIDEKMEPGTDLKSNNDIVSSWIRKGLTKEQCQNETMISFLAGTESTAQVLRSTFLNIVSAPTVYGRLSEEIKNAIDVGGVSTPVIKNKEATVLPYLQACIKEGLRIYQPLNGLESKRAPPEGLVWKGYRIPGGTEIGISQYSLLHRKDVFGQDAKLYRPERWLDNSDPAKLSNMNSVLGMAFGGGTGLCLGKNIALLELNKVVFELFRTFDFQLTDPLAGIPTYVRGTVIQTGINVRAYPKRFI